MPTDEFDVFELTKMGVKKNFRNQGVGSLLINECIEKVKLDKQKKSLFIGTESLKTQYIYINHLASRKLN